MIDVSALKNKSFPINSIHLNSLQCYYLITFYCLTLLHDYKE